MHNDTESQGIARRLMSRETIEAKIIWRVAELRVIAARTALEYARMRTSAAWRAFDKD